LSQSQPYAPVKTRSLNSNLPSPTCITVTRESDTALFTVHGPWGRDEVRITFAETPRLQVHRTAGSTTTELFTSP
jgi:hypothetical protein